MAKRKADSKREDFSLDMEMEEKEGIGSKVLSMLIGMVVFLILIRILAVCIKLDLGSIGSGVLRPILKDIPIVNMILPDVSDGNLAIENGYAYDNLPDAIAKINELEKMVKELEEASTTKTTTIAELETKLKGLEELEKNVKDFNNRVYEFDKNVVFNEKAPEIEEYKQFYEGINADNAAEIYRQVVEQQVVDDLTKAQADRYAKMEPSAAADALEIMTADLDLVADILSTMSTAKAAAIMQEMEPDFCAKITKKMSLVE